MAVKGRDPLTEAYLDSFTDCNFQETEIPSVETRNYAM